MKSWTSSRINKPANKPPEEVVEVAKEAEATTADAVIVVVEEVAVVVAVVAEAVVVVEQADLRKKKERQTAQAESGHDENGGHLGLRHTREYVRQRNERRIGVRARTNKGIRYP